MMKALGKYLQNRELAISGLLARPRHQYTPVTFHKLRVEIKKLNALFDLINFCAKDFKRNKTFQPFKQLFRQAGKVRELQLEAAMVKRYCPPHSLKDYRNEIRQARLKEQAAYFSMRNAQLTAQLKKKFTLAATFLSCVTNKKAGRYLEKKQATVQAFLQPSGLQTAQLHEFRKHIKLLQYNRKMLAMDDQTKSNTKKDRLPVLIGKWHDAQVMLGHLQKAIETIEITPQQIRQLERIKTKISLESDLLLNQINTAIPAAKKHQAKKLAAGKT